MLRKDGVSRSTIDVAVNEIIRSQRVNSFSLRKNVFMPHVYVAGLEQCRVGWFLAKPGIAVPNERDTARLIFLAVGDSDELREIVMEGVKILEDRHVCYQILENGRLYDTLNEYLSINDNNKQSRRVDRDLGKDTLKRFVRVVNQRGLHARASRKFVLTCQRFQSEIWVSFGGLVVCGTSIMGLMMLDAKLGDVLQFLASGPDAEEALDELEQLVAGGF